MKKYLLVLLVIASIAVNGQVRKYNFSASAGTYNVLTGGTIFQAGAAAGTDAISANIALPFAFRYNNKEYSTVKISNNGFIAFGTQNTAASIATPLSSGGSTVTYDGAIAAFGINLVNSTMAGAAPQISYGTDGNDFVVQFQDMARNTFGASERINFQIRLTQVTNTITFVYGTNVAGSSVAAFPEIGLRGGGVADFSNRVVNANTGSNTWTTSIGGNLAIETARFTSASPAAVPTNGLTYTWTPPVRNNPSPVFATLPFTENFNATWANLDDQQDVPQATNWRAWPPRGDMSWRRNDIPDTTVSSWSSILGAPAVALPASGTYARFHTFNTPVKTGGNIDVYLDFSGNESKELRFDYINTTGTDSLFLELSTNGGTSFSPLASFGVQAEWFTKIVSTNAVTPNAVLRFRGIGDFGTTDMGIDNISVMGTSCLAPVSLTATAATASTATLGWSSATASQFEYAVTTSMQPPAAGTTISNSSVTVNNLAPATRYFLHVRSVCGTSSSSWNSIIFNTLPENDNCSNAISLIANQYANCANAVSGSTVGATQSSETAPSCSATGTNDDVWYSFTATSSTHFINITNASNTTAAAVYSGTCGALVPVANACASTNVTVQNLTPGTTYYVRVYTTAPTAGTFSTFDICITSPPVNNECTGAIALLASSNNVCSASVAGSTLNATQSSAAAPSCSPTGINDDVWYSFVATAAQQTVIISTPSVPIAAAIYSGDCTSLTQVSGACATGYTQASGLTPGQTYYVRVYTTSALAYLYGSFSICVISAPENDECSGAVTLPVSNTNYCTFSTNGSTNGATASGGTAPACYPTGINDDVWYSFTAIAPAHSITISGANTNINAQVYSGTCSNLLLVPGGCISTNGTVSGLTIGEKYFIRVYTGLPTPSTTTDFSICVGAAAPVNDECSGAISLNVGQPGVCKTMPGSTVGGTESAEPSPLCASGIDVWYSFVATGTAHIITVSNAPAAIAIYSGSCGNLVQLPGICGNGTVTAKGLSIGATYYVRIYTTSSISQYASFDVCVTSLLENDECEGAITLNQQPFSSNPTTINVNTTHATQSANSSSCFTSSQDDDLWYGFKASSNTLIIRLSNATLTTGTQGAFNWALYTGLCGALVEYKCSAFNFANGDIAINGLSMGTDYFLRTLTSGTGGRASWDMALLEPDASLPVALISFDGKHVNNTSVLTWKTVSEQNNKGFEIQRSIDGRNFLTLGFVSAAEAKKENSQNLYSFTDYKAAITNNYYRLKQVDLDGRTVVSPVIFIKAIYTNELTVQSIYPVPTVNQLNIAIDAPAKETLTIVVSDLSGKRLLHQVLTTNVGSTNVAVDVSRLTAGTYLVQVIPSNNTAPVIRKFVKQ